MRRTMRGSLAPKSNRATAGFGPATATAAVACATSTFTACPPTWMTRSTLGSAGLETSMTATPSAKATRSVESSSCAEDQPAIARDEDVRLPPTEIHRCDGTRERAGGVEAPRRHRGRATRDDAESGARGHAGEWTHWRFPWRRCECRPYGIAQREHAQVSGRAGVEHKEQGARDGKVVHAFAPEWRWDRGQGAAGPSVDDRENDDPTESRRVRSRRPTLVAAPRRDASGARARARDPPSRSMHGLSLPFRLCASVSRSGRVCRTG